MIKLPVCLLFAAAVVAANPFVVTYLNEVSADSTHQFVELHGEPDGQPADLNGWQIVTSTSVCTLTCQLQYDEYLVVDSEALALGDIGHGALWLNPSGDSVFLLDDTGYVEDRVHFPRSPTRHDSAPLPPSTGSIAFWNYDDAEGQSMNWYIDMTPTPGEENDDYGVIAGSVTGPGGDTLEEVVVAADGLYGSCHRGLYQETGYGIGGLGAGKYLVRVYAYHQGHSYEATYPESVAVGYGQTVGGINIVIPLTGVAENPPAPLLPLVRASGRILLLSGDGTAPVNLQLYNQVGSRVSAFRLGPIEGEKRIELPATLTPGVYFAEAQKGTHRSTLKVVLW